MAELLPLFPLQLVALPGNAIRLHIFEPRYREMVGEAEARGGEFGIVLAKDGGIVNAGCTVFVESVVQRYADGRFDIVARGRRRFKLLSVNDDEACLRGDLEFFSDEDMRAAEAEYRLRAIELCLELHAILKDDTPAPAPDIADPELSFRLAPTLPDLDFLDAILRDRSETARLQRIIATVPKYLERLHYVEKMKRAIPGNGSGHKHKGI